MEWKEFRVVGVSIAKFAHICPPRWSFGLEFHWYSWRRWNFVLVADARVRQSTYPKSIGEK